MTFLMPMFFVTQDDGLWSCLAAMATYAKDLNTAEVAYAAIKEVKQILLGCFLFA